MAIDINTELANAHLRHLGGLERLENGVIKDLIPVLRQAKADIKQILISQGSGIPTGTDVFQTLSPSQVGRLNALIGQIDETLGNANRIITGQINRELLDLAAEEPLMLTRILNRTMPKSIPLRLTFDRLPIDTLQAIVNTPLGGDSFAVKLRKNYGLAVDRMKAQLTNSLITGQTVQQASKDIMRILDDTVMTRASNIVRTEFARVAATADLLVARDNADIVNNVVWLSALDSRVCIICMGLHGKEFKLDTNTQPPAHPRCRCTYVFKLKTPRQMGVNKSDLPDGVYDRLQNRSPLGSLPNNFDDWLKIQPDSVQREMLGATRYKLFNQGVSTKQMATDKRVLTLQELGDRGLLTQVPQTPTTTPPTFSPETPHSGFKPAATQDEAISRIESLITRRIDDPRLLARYLDGQLAAGVDFRGMKLEHLNSILRGIEPIMQKYNLQVHYIGHQTRRSKTIASYAWAGDKRQGWASLQFRKSAIRDGGVKLQQDTIRNVAYQNKKELLNLQTVVDKNPALKAGYAERIEAHKALTRWATYDDSTDVIRDMARHEVYHAVYFKHDLDNVWVNNLKKYNVNLVDRYSVSKYAASSDKELFPEVGTLIDRGDIVPDNLKQAFLDTVQYAIDNMDGG